MKCKRIKLTKKKFDSRSKINDGQKNKNTMGINIGVLTHKPRWNTEVLYVF